MKIDTRAGSKDLIFPLRQLGVPVEEAILPAGDAEIVGNGPDGPMMVGVEAKTVEDAITCMRNGRFADQARGMRDYYEVRWLLVYGRTRSERGVLASLKGNRWRVLPNRPTEQEYGAWLLSMTQSNGMLLWQAEDELRAAKWLRWLWLWWTAKEWDEHRAHLNFYQAPVSHNPFKKPTLALRVAHVLPGIGDKKAHAAANHFKSARNILLADEASWMQIEGIGKKTAEGIVSGVTAEEGAEK